MSHTSKSISASVERASSGGFVAVASSASVDRDGEVIAVGAFAPLPNSVPCHVDHVMSAAGVVGRGRPYYSGDALYVDVALGSGPDAQAVRQKIIEGLLDTVSIAFLGTEWATIAGQRTLVRGELLAVDLVSVPSNRDARVLSVRGYSQSPTDLRNQARRLTDDCRYAMMRADLAEAQRFLAELDAPARHGPMRTQVEMFLRGRP